MNKINFRKQNIPFTQVANGVLNDSNLSFAAKGLYGYLYSKPEGWDFSENRISQESKNGRFAVRTAIKELADNGYLKRYKLPDGRMIYRVVYPPLNPESGNQTLGDAEPKSGNRTVRKPHCAETRPISNKYNTSNKEEEVIRMSGNEIVPCSVTQVRIGKDRYTSTFESFWLQYPKKISKTVALKSWLRIKPDNGLHKKILDALEAHKKSPQWLRDGGQFIPYPSTWLNQGRWEDEIETEVSSKPIII